MPIRVVSRGGWGGRCSPVCLCASVKLGVPPEVSDSQLSLINTTHTDGWLYDYVRLIFFRRRQHRPGEFCYNNKQLNGCLWVNSVLHKSGAEPAPGASKVWQWFCAGGKVWLESIVVKRRDLLRSDTVWRGCVCVCVVCAQDGWS